MSRRVHFIAMSGVRIYDPELSALGMTLPGFIERGKVIASLPSLGLLTLAGLTPPHWETFYREVDRLDEETIANLTDQPADLVAISSLAARIEDAYRLADRLRAAGKRIVLGGLHATAMPEEAAGHADAVVVGEGEPVWAQVLADAETGFLKPIYRSIPARAFDPVSVPAYHLLNVDRYNRIPLQTTRGCPLDCEFCAASRLISPYKRKPLDQIELELEAIKAIWPRPFIELADDNTFVHKPWAKELVQMLARHRIKWFTETDISVADDEELLDMLAESGCAQLLIGLESVDENALRLTDSKSWKRRRRDRYLEAIERIQSRGISVNGCFVLGFDTDGPTCFERTATFVREAKLSEVQVTILTPFPGTAFYNRLKREGRLLRDRFWNRCTLFDVNLQPQLMTAEELRSGFRELVRELYSEPETAKRRAHFLACNRSSRARRAEVPQPCHI